MGAVKEQQTHVYVLKEDSYQRKILRQYPLLQDKKMLISSLTPNETQTLINSMTKLKYSEGYLIQNLSQNDKYFVLYMMKLNSKLNNRWLRTEYKSESPYGNQYTEDERSLKKGISQKQKFEEGSKIFIFIFNCL